ncbi:CDP-Glycerol:Poly(glycerophosphate) glycerophosphotransferase [Gluconobacter cerinus]|uniref:CDP-Glycerol:Poly(Glycerophosphate) glycerophosphotransferase n=2 Tax=Gluconobacter cerinus TaxID=38307 RepID=A0A1B6VJZ6_9PROT|nr:CDP-Glycerol:Poly(glycerophosphate) glycerophosphotransferase [Gluconobacter cerinus]
MKNVAFLYIAESYQCYHAAAIALELAQSDKVNITNFYNDPETPYHLERVRYAAGAPEMEYRPLRRSLPTAAMQSIRILGMFKDMVLRDNAAELDRYDAIVTVEDTVASARRLGISSPQLIYIPHGCGDRARGFTSEVRAFDHVLLSGQKSAQRMLDNALIKPENHSVIGSVKLETCKLFPDVTRFFSIQRPTVLYNAHKARGLSSWKRFIEPLLEQFSKQSDFNLIVAPHTKMFRRRRQSVRDSWNERSSSQILIDTGSERCVDMTYTSAVDIYVGDVSSQVYEFLETPRPCVFLNAHQIDWRNNPDFTHWHFGDVVDDPRDLLNIIRAAPERHRLYRDRQQEMADRSLGDRSPGAARRGANVIRGLLNR